MTCTLFQSLLFSKWIFEKSLADISIVTRWLDWALDNELLILLRQSRIQLEAEHWQWLYSNVPLLAEVNCSFLEPWWRNSRYLHLLTSSIWPIVKQCSQQSLLRYCETDPKRTSRQLRRRPFHQRSHIHSPLLSKKLSLASVPSSTTPYCCDFPSVQLWLCSLFTRHLKYVAVHEKSFLEDCWAVWLDLHYQSGLCTSR